MLLTIIFACLLLGCTASSSTEENQQVKHTKSIPTHDIVEPKDERPKTIERKDTIPLDWVMGKISYEKDSHFVKIPTRYADRAGLYLHRKAFEAYKAMYEAAKKDSIDLQIRSAARNFNYQKGIWERKFEGITKVDGKNLTLAIPDKTERARKILEYSSMPGTSRHHWGTDIDLNAFNNKYFETGKGLKVYNWLQTHAPRFGFCQPYTEFSKERTTGYFEEKWHWSYLPLANQYMRTAQHLKAEDIKGFKGAEAAVPLDVVNNYVQGIHPSCQPN